MSQMDDTLSFDADLTSLLDEDGNEYEFEVLDEIDYKDGHYYVLMPLFDLPEEEIISEETYVILEAVEDENGDPQLAELEDPALAEEINAVYERRQEEFDNNSPKS